MIDIHCHLLHGLDDGSMNLEDAVAMARSAVHDGVSTILATPHYNRGRYDTDSSVIRERAKELSTELEHLGIPLRVMIGQEIRVHSQLLEDLEAGHLLPLGESSYVLLEFPSSRVPQRFEEMVHELRITGLRPIIAHPERNAEIAADPGRLAALVECGALCQITSHSLTGRFGRSVKSVALDLCRRNLVHFIASDAHNATTRPYELSSAYRAAAEKLGADIVEYYKRNARAVVHNIPVIHKPTLQRRRPKSLFRGWSLFRS
ncbi:Tyrosine-protein phosphatase YwqE [Paenibacillus plantiphilus]|uniref:Tyrosine-protein phosphatase n=1 Tax=Paenibacillus plantiphilus TaxID=2905650 RepID=A0ABN8GI35_9BACL|nr:CpsB/CapC family capsule biosynthesis tyrosine phosphatase [Paenibacillus plantiphilus]CAH1206820.1 Tyrosine-protein phosphatase YwqE [Paenibacillus plantiphilus]